MMLISLGAMLLVWAAFIWLYDPDGVREPSHPMTDERRKWIYY